MPSTVLWPSPPPPWAERVSQGNDEMKKRRDEGFSKEEATVSNEIRNEERQEKMEVVQVRRARMAPGGRGQTGEEDSLERRQKRKRNGSWDTRSREWTGKAQTERPRAL